MENSVDKKIKDQALFLITDLSTYAALIDLGFFLAIVLLTPVYHRYPLATPIFGGVIGTLSFYRYLLSKTRKSWSQVRLPLWKTMFRIGFYLNAIAWGVMCSGAIAVLELGWTSFLIMLITVSLAATKVPILAPDFSLVRNYLLILFAPAAIVPALTYSGQRGWALASFFSGFFFVLLLQALNQHRAFWASARESARLNAMLDAIPCTLSWVNSNLNYLGVNQKLADLWGMKSEEFVGRPLGFSDKRSRMTAFTKDMFSSATDTQSKELLVQVNDENRYYYIVGKKFNLNTEAVVLGLDVTDYRNALEELQKQKNQSNHLAKFASFGERTADLALEIRACLGEIRKGLGPEGLVTSMRQDVGSVTMTLFGEQGGLTRVERAVHVIENLLDSHAEEVECEIDLNRLLNDTLSVFRTRLKAGGIDLRLEKSDISRTFKSKPYQIQGVLMCLINNSVSAIQGQPSPWISVAVSDLGRGISISVTDSGNGIPPEVRDRIFDPLFTTKDGKKSSGVGLTVSRDIISQLGGKLVLDSSCPNTRFTIGFEI